MNFRKLQLPLLSILVASIFFNVSCKKREVEEKPNFPSAEYYSPVQAKQGDTVLIHGKYMKDAVISIDGQTLNSVYNDDELIKVVIPASISNSNKNISIVFSNGDKHTFASPLAIRDTRGGDVMLISDFDGAGIRKAVATSNFNNGFWEANTAGATTAGIGKNINNIPASPAGGNYLFAHIPASGIMPNTYGFVASFSTRSEVMNNGQTAWPVNFITYPNSPIKENTPLSNIFLNFYVNVNGYDKTQIRVFLYNLDITKPNRVAYTKTFSETEANSGWRLISIPFSEFRDNYGNTRVMNVNDLKEVNKIEFDISDNFNNSYPDNKIEFGVQAYIDQVSISVGSAIDE